jgi:signal transduction histidine kinase
VQVLNNLVHNAVKFTEQGHVRVTAVRDGDMVRVAVQDTGPGVVPEHRDAIFEKFRQSDRFITREHGGAGLGLALAKQLVEAMGGRLTLESVVGDGSTFTFTLPIGTVTAAPVAASARSPEESVA